MPFAQTFKCDFEMSPTELATYSASVVRLSNSPTQFYSAIPANATIPIYFWVNKSSMDVAPTASEISAAVDRLNTYFHFANNARFVLCGLSYINDSRFYRLLATDRESFKNAYHKDKVINVYVPDALWSSGTLGHATRYPNVSCIFINSLQSEYYLQTFAHEMGHIFSLRHTFSDDPNVEERVIREPDPFKLAPNWGSTADLMRGTTADTYDCNLLGCSQPPCTQRDDNNDLYVSDRTNIMSYFDCKYQFVPEQQRFMDDFLASDLSYLINAPCVGNSAGFGSLQRVSSCDVNIRMKNTQVQIKDVNNNLICTPLTEQDAYFRSCNLPKNSNVIVNPVYNLLPKNGVTTFDIALISRHVLGIQEFIDPYTRLAADVDNSGEIDATDMLYIRRLVLNMIPDFPNNVNSWRFVPEYFLHQPSFLSSFNQDPFAATYQNYGYNSTNSYMDKVRLDLSTEDGGRLWAWTFRPFKVGDVNCSSTPPMIAPPIGEEPSTPSPSSALTARVANNNCRLLSTRNVSVSRTSEKMIVLKAKSAGRIAALQVGFRFLPSKMTIKEIEKGEFNSSNDVSDFSKEDKGQLRALWFHKRGESKNISVGTTLLKVKVKANENIDNIINVLNLDDNILQNEFYDKNGNLVPMDLEWELEEDNNDNSSGNSLRVNAFPNPFTNELTFEINTPAADAATITIGNIITGQNIVIQRQLVQGLNTVRINNASSLPFGMLSYTIRSGSRVINGTLNKAR